MINIARLPSESDEEYCMRICSLKDLYGTWSEIAHYLNEELNCNYSADKYRKSYYRYCKEQNSVLESDINESLLDIQKERVKLRDERTQINSIIRELAREETLKEIAEDVANIVSNKKLLSKNKYSDVVSDNKGILVISDWHYGLDVDTFYNKYDTDIAKERVCELLNESIKIIKKEEISELFVINLGDMISGLIHLPLRINSRIDVITQTIEVSEILAEFLNDLSEFCKINYGSVTDNHSRIDPNKRESLQVESFVRIIDWYLKKRLESNENIIFLSNKFGDDICSFKVFDFKVLGVHGDKDPQKKILTQLTSFTQEHYDLILSAHKHHFYADEHNDTELYSNGSLMGTDYYASSLRCNSKPSQLFIVSDTDNISRYVYKIKLK